MHALKDRPDVTFDNKQGEQGFCSFIRSLPQKSGNTIRLFERSAGEFYSIHGDDALYIAQNVYKTTSVIKYLGGNVKTGVPSCALSRQNLETFLRDALMNKQMKIEIWAQEQKKANYSWKIIQQASPGNIQDLEDFLFSNVEISTSPVVLSVKLQNLGDQKIVGVAFADTTIRELGVSEFIDNELFSNFESLLIQLGVKECIIQSDEAHKDYELTKLREVIEKCDIVITELKKSHFNTKDIEQDLNRLLGDEISVASLPEFEMKHAMAACASIIKYLSLLTDTSNFGYYILRHHDLSQYMKLDASALRALNLMPSQHDGPNKNASLYGLLNKCKTSQGSRMLSQWLKQPLMNLKEIEQRQTFVEIFVNDTELRQSLREDHLNNLPDLHRLAKRFQRGKATLQDVIRVYQAIQKLPGLICAFELFNSMDDTLRDLIEEIFLTKLKEHNDQLEKFKELVETTVDFEAAEHHHYVLKADFNDELKVIKEKLDKTMREMNKEHQMVGRKLGLDPEKKLHFEKQATYGYCLRMSRLEANCLRGQSEYIELATQRTGVFFTTRKLKELSSEFLSESEHYDDVQSSLVKEVINISASYCPALETLNVLLAHIDVLVTFADVSIRAPTPYIRPKMMDKGEGHVILKNARHPCLEIQDDVSFIPNDVELIRDQSELQIITGPNMGGKSTYIRQIGVIALMAQVGCFVPCTEASLCIFDSILARVGAGDSQLRGVSTFMLEMLETATILKTATTNSLIIIDELGRGTSTYDGFGLAWAISEYISTQIRCFCLFATHFHELTALSEEVPHVRNLHVTAHIDQKACGTRDITLLYKVTEGICDESFGIHVAELANFPEIAVKLARRKANELEVFMKHEKDQDEKDKCSKQEIEEGDIIIKEFLRDIAQTPDIESMNYNSILDRIQEVKGKYQEKIEGNPWCRDVIAGF
ncbi:putative DNA mismatch repair protein MSH2 [Gigaspora rosea]|uniref:DNA mismatch repair protein MSH2 n=1 Tax=Gigaspora rosea TaxID=44941 RepID=A0A397VPD3_9GLOM|nr:putative DNA mismatch repair protein MSH2 [Gigaspora rosea]